MSSDTVPRTRVLRGAAAARIRGVSMDADLSLLRPIVPPSAQTVQAAEEAAIALREEASRVGYEDGYAAGRTRAAEDAAAEIRALSAGVTSALNALESAAAALSAQQSVTVADAERHITAMAVQIAETILGRELAACDAAARDAITRALQLAPPRVDATARLHPDDIATIGDLESLAGDRTVTLLADPAVERGGCVLDVGPCRIDAQVGPALARVRKELGA
jgi:flagellar assembly protein FliH